MKELLQHTSLDVLGLTETWLTSDIDDDELEIEGYSIFREDRGTKGKSEGGGVITYVKSCLKVVPLQNVLDADIEGKLIKIERSRCKPMIIGTFYRPPNFDPYKFIEALSNSFTNLDTSKNEFVIMGDFNIDFSSKKGSKLQRSFKSFLLSHDLHQIIEKATRVTEYSETLIDFICVNNKHRVVQWEVNDTHLSDHSIVVCVLKGGVPKTPFRIIEYRSYKKFNKEQFCSDLKEMPWNELNSIGCIDEAATHWESLFNRVADKHAPIKKQRVKGFKTPWVTNEVLQLRRERNYHQSKGRKTRSLYHWQMYRSLRNHINRLEKRLKSEHFCKMIDENKNDSSRMWKSLKDALPRSANHSVSVIKSGKKVLSKPVQVAEVFNKHFTTIGQKIAKAFGKGNKDARGILQKKTDKSFQLDLVTSNFVKIQLQNLKTNKAIGLDKISARLLKDSADIIAPSLQALINKSFLEGKFPKNWKSAKVVALFKSGDKSNCDNYRPISILPTISKIIERAVHKQFYEFLQVNNLLFKDQFGFRNKMSTSSALLQLTDSLLESMDKGHVSGVVYLDLKKAFDTVDHSLLLWKLTEYGVSTACLKWFRSYLSQRSQQTSVGDALSLKRNVTIGVPQGSVLGPLLFLVFINDLPLSLKYSNTILFADDSVIYYSGKNCNEIQNKMNEDLALVKEWLNDHRLTLNITKSKFVVVGGKQQLKRFKDMTLKIKEDELSRETSYKYLGIIINENMTWGDHIASLQQKVEKRIGLLKRISHLIPRAQRLTLVNTMIIPLFDYGDTVWGIEITNVR